MNKLPLSGVRVVEMAGLAPVPMCGMILADFGAKVIRVDRVGSILPGGGKDPLGSGKQSIAVNLKSASGVGLVRKLVAASDVLLEPYRPGVMERLGLGPNELLKENPNLIYARLTGFGQSGPLAHKAGHDINYVAISGLLSFFGRKSENPHPPVNFAADFAGGSMSCAFGILAALLARQRTGRGQVIDASMVEGSAYIGSFLWKSQSEIPYIWGNPRGENFLDGGKAFYETYKTKDARYVAVGALEPQFFNALQKGLGFSGDELPQFGDDEANRKLLTETFASKTQAEWTAIFSDVDACVTPVLPFAEAHSHPHNVARGSFIDGVSGPEPAPAPRLSDTPAQRQQPHVLPDVGEHTDEVLLHAGFSQEEIARLKQDGDVHQRQPTAKL